MKKYLLVFVILSFFIGCDDALKPENKDVTDSGSESGISDYTTDPPPAEYDGLKLATPGLWRYAPINVRAVQVGMDIHITWEMPEKCVEPRVFVIRYKVPDLKSYDMYYWSNPADMAQNNPDYVIVNARSAIVKDSPNNYDIRMWQREFVYDYLSVTEGHYKYYTKRDFDIMVSAIYWGDDRYIDLVFPGDYLDDGYEHRSFPYTLTYKW
jgi:hypothetical protein